LAVEVKLKQLIRVSWLNYSYQTYLLEFPSHSREAPKIMLCYVLCFSFHILTA